MKPVPQKSFKNYSGLILETNVQDISAGLRGLNGGTRLQRSTGRLPYTCKVSPVVLLLVAS